MENYNYIGVATEELYRIFNIFNKQYFRNSLVHPIITIQSAPRKNTAGWFTMDKVWTTTGEEDTTSKHEINIVPEWLNNTALEIAHTVLHEMVHYNNKCNDMKDHSDNVHNKIFKQQAERVGLHVDKDPKVGWGLTSLTPELIKFIEANVQPNKECFLYFRKVKGKPAAKESEKKTFKYMCVGCEQEAKGKEGLQLVCGLCGEVMPMEPKD